MSTAGQAADVAPGPRRQVAPAASTCRAALGTSLLEVVMVLSLSITLGAIGVTGLRQVRDERAGREAARLLMRELHTVAYDARRRATDMAVVVDQTAAGGPVLRVVADGNGNGVRTADVAAGIDRPVGSPRRAFAEGAARLAIVQPVPTTDHTGTLAAGSDPVRFGIAPFIVFSARRTGSSGSIYIAGPAGAQYAIRVLGSTGRLRLLCLDARAWRWEGC